MSRQSSLIYSRMWLDGTMKEILYEYSKDTFTVAVYLMTTPHAHMCGVYYLPYSEIGEHCNLSMDEVTTCMDELESLGFCKYDHKVKVVWVVNMWRYQIGDPIKPTDLKYKGMMTHLNGLPTTGLVSELRSVVQMKIDTAATLEGHAKGHAKGLVKGLTQGASEATDTVPRSHPIPSSSLPQSFPQPYPTNGGLRDFAERGDE